MKGNCHRYSCDTNDRHLIHIYLVVVSIGFAYLIQIGCESMDIKIPWWFSVPGIFSIYGLLYYVFSHSLWKMSFMRGIFFIKTPIIEGQYIGTLKSSFDNFAINKNIEIRIKQSWDRICISLTTDSSKSYSQTCSIGIQNSESPTITYMYLNEPKAESVKSLEMHYGMCTLFLNKNQLSGDFFTGRGRQTYGMINTAKHKD